MKGNSEEDGTVEFFFSEVSDEQIAQEKAKARKLRNSQWWKRRRSIGLCHYCGRRFKPSDLTLDHVVPLARGGKSTKGNTVPACKECNNKKKYLLPIEWVEYLAWVQTKEGI